MNEKIHETIKEIIFELVNNMGIDADIEEERVEDMGNGQEVFTVNLSTKDPNLLIGQYGSNLQCLQHLAGIIIKKKMFGEKSEWELNNNEIKFNIDVNNYKKQKKESLVKLAEVIANQVVYNKNSVALRPMSSYERKVIHTEISNRKNLETESIGEELMRRVVIKYIDE